MASQPEAWLRGPVDGVSPHLQPIAHGLLHYSEEMIAALEGLTSEVLVARPNEIASIAFHVRHSMGSLDRLFTYARGESLSESQMRALALEKSADDPGVQSSALIDQVRASIEAALAELRGMDESVLLEYRPVGRAKLPSTVIGLLSHAAEHTARHTGQIVTTARLVRGESGRG